MTGILNYLDVKCTFGEQSYTSKSINIKNNTYNELVIIDFVQIYKIR